MKQNDDFNLILKDVYKLLFPFSYYTAKMTFLFSIVFIKISKTS